MDRKYRLTSSMDFKRVRRTGKSYAHPLVILLAAPNGLDISRIGVTASRSMGGAVLRNRSKRRLRSILSQFRPQIEAGWDIVLIARPALLEADWPHLCESIAGLLRRASILGLDQ